MLSTSCLIFLYLSFMCHVEDEEWCRESNRKSEDDKTFLFYEVRNVTLLFNESLHSSLLALLLVFLHIKFYIYLILISQMEDSKSSWESCSTNPDINCELLIELRCSWILLHWDFISIWTWAWDSCIKVQKSSLGFYGSGDVMSLNLLTVVCKSPLKIHLFWKFWSLKALTAK